MWRVLGTVLVCLAVASVVLMATFTVKLSNVTECQTRYNEAFRAATEERGLAAAADRGAIREFLLAVAAPEATDQSRVEAYQLFLSRLDAADNRRSDNPLPTEACG
jgi:hypothetical protein